MPVRVSPIRLLPDAEFRSLIERSGSVKQVLRYFRLGPTGGNRLTVQKRIRELGISVSHLGQHHRSVPQAATPLEQILVRGSTYNRSHLKARLLKEGFIKNECSICGLGQVWNGKSIAMRLDHKNGVRDDNRLPNLRMVCPNCDSQLDTFSNRNWAKTKLKRVRLCSGCGKVINKHGKHGKCVKCYSSGNLKISWPPLEELFAMIEANGYLQTGKRLGVSDNAVRKRIKALMDTSTNVAVPTTGTSG